MCPIKLTTNHPKGNTHELSSHHPGSNRARSYRYWPCHREYPHILRDILMAIYIVYVTGWHGEHQLFSIRRTEEGAKKAVAEANKAYCTESAYVDDGELLD